MTNTTTATRLDQKVVIVGGGPSGASAAIAMSNRGYTNVHLYEAYPHPKLLSKTSDKAYVISLSYRGIRGIIDATGIDVFEETLRDDSPVGVACCDLARHVTHAKTNKTSSKTMHNADAQRAVATRQRLTEHLLDAAVASGVTIHFRHKLAELDFDTKVAKFDATTTTDEKTPVAVPYDLLVAADGSRSKVRTLMAENLPDFTVRIEEDSMEYQVATLPKNPFGDSHPKGCSHAWNSKEQNAIAMAFPTKKKKEDGSINDQENSLTLAIVFPEGNLEKFRETGYKEPLTKLIPDIVTGGTDGDATLKLIEDQLRENQIANGGLCVWSSRLGHVPSGILLLGDAGHGMWPSLGQGANCALESVGVFVKCLDGLDDEKHSKGDWTTELISSFHDARHEDALSAVDLTYGGIGARESRGRKNAPLSGKLQMVGMILLSKLTLGTIPMPALLRIIIGAKDDLTYTRAKKFHFGYEKYICLGALAVWVAGTISMGRRIFSGSNAGAEL